MYYKRTNHGYIIAIGIGSIGESISAKEYFTIGALASNKPIPEEGYTYLLRADTLEWELVELPPTEDEPSVEEPTGAWDVEQGEFIPVGRIITVHGVMYECIKDHFAAWSKQPPNDEYWRTI